MLSRSMLTIVALTAAVSVANAATLTNVAGQVSVNSGTGFVPVSSAVVLNPGDRVMTGAGSSAEIVYGANCTVSVAGSQTVSVLSDSPCTTVGQPNNTGLVVGGLLAAGGAAAAVLSLSKSGSSPTYVPTPVSP